MKAIAFNGSPRKGGNTEFLLKKVLEPIRETGIETDLIQIGGKQVRLFGLLPVPEKQRFAMCNQHGYGK